MAIIDRIKYDGPEDSSSWLIHKYFGEEFVLGSQLIVNQGQEALFFKGGEALDLFGAGTHTLHSGNLPILKKLVNLPFGGKTPFSAEVYYINRTSRLDMNWGTQNPIQLEDPKYGLLLSIRSHGTYGLRVVDSRRFVSELVGAIPGGTTINHAFVAKHFNGQLAPHIKAVISRYMIDRKISFLEVSSYLLDISAVCQEELSKVFERFGIELVHFSVESIKAPEESYEKLRGYKEELALGNDFYRQRRSFDVMDAMAANPASGGMANAGIGLGMGLGMIPVAQDLFSTVGNNANLRQPDAAAASGAAVCPHCNAQNPAGQKFCGECGKPMIVGAVCPACGKVNPIGQKFCGDCGAKLAKKCPACGTDNELSQKFCGNCGEKL
jgi:membrane protease subunit (stomatin/prohibitin family)